MKKTLSLLLLLSLFARASAYNDHRVRNLDSLERVVAAWTPESVEKASSQELVDLNGACRALMRGYSQINGEKSTFYARKALDISLREGWAYASADAFRYLGQAFWYMEEYDSAQVYFGKALENVERMEAGASSPTRPDAYTQRDIDDMRSALYGATGNLYNEMGDIPRAMDLYARAGAIFDKYGWNHSNSVLYYNIGETWLAEGDLKASEKAYRRSLDYAVAAKDSLLASTARKGLGRIYLEKGQTFKALRYLHQADEYYSAHDKEESVWRKENFEYISLALRQQRKMLAWLLAGLVLVMVLSAGILLLSRRLRRSRKEQAETAVLMEETLQEIKSVPSGDIRLSAREKDILDLLSKGYTAPDIAQALGLSTETIRWYRKKLIAKLDVSNTAELISIAKDQGLI